MSRALAALLDGAIINVRSSRCPGSSPFSSRPSSTPATQAPASSSPAPASGSRAWALYLIGFWALAGKTLGMHFVGIRLDSPDGRRIGVRRAVRRLFGLVVSVLALGLGLLAIAFNRDRRGWQDRMAGTDVVYVDGFSPESALVGD